VTSIFSIVLVFSSSLPLILPLGLIFFIVKFYVDFNQRVILRQAYYSADMRHSDNTVRSSVVKYLFTAGVLYLLINSLIFTASTEGMKISYASFALFGIWFLVCVLFWLRWRLNSGAKVGVKYDSSLLGFDIKELSELYMHPLEQTFPSPLPNRRRDDVLNERKDSNARVFG
jgi:hypothetical protein